MVESWLVVEPQVNKIKKDITAVHHQPKNFHSASFAVEKLSKLERPSFKKKFTPAGDGGSGR